MNCPACGGSSKVVDSRDCTNSRRRRRECESCSRRFTTTEVYGIKKGEDFPLLVADVIKRDGEIEKFDESKLRKSVEHACTRLQLPTEEVNDLIVSLVEKINGEPTAPMKVNEIVDTVIESLSTLSKIAALRYAIQYNDFSTPEQFRKYSAKLDK